MTFVRLTKAIRLFWEWLAMIDFEIKGVENTLRALEEKLGTNKVNRAASKALRTAGEQGADTISEAISVYSRTGEMTKSVVYSRMKNRGGEQTVEIGMQGDRQPLWHLQEWGYNAHGTYNGVSPRGEGIVRETADSMSAEFEKTIRETLKGVLGL